VRFSGTDLPSNGDLVEMTIDTIRAFGMVVWATSTEFAVAFDAELKRFEVENVRRRSGMPELATFAPEERQAIEDWLLCVSR
jgi:hypothetical protein